jgi:hypothetical protein
MIQTFPSLPIIHILPLHLRNPKLGSVIVSLSGSSTWGCHYLPILAYFPEYCKSQPVGHRALWPTYASPTEASSEDFLTEYLGPLILPNNARGRFTRTVDQAVFRYSHSPGSAPFWSRETLSNTGTDWSDLNNKQSRIARALGILPSFILSSFLTQLSNVFVPLSPAPADTPHFNFQLHALLKPDALVLSGSLPCVPRHFNSLRGLEGHPHFINFSSYSIPNWTENFSLLGNH